MKTQDLELYTNQLAKIGTISRTQETAAHPYDIDDRDGILYAIAKRNDYIVSFYMDAILDAEIAEDLDEQNTVFLRDDDNRVYMIIKPAPVIETPDALKFNIMTFTPEYGLDYECPAIGAIGGKFFDQQDGLYMVDDVTREALEPLCTNAAMLDYEMNKVYKKVTAAVTKSLPMLYKAIEWNAEHSKKTGHLPRKAKTSPVAIKYAKNKVLYIYLQTEAGV